MKKELAVAERLARAAGMLALSMRNKLTISLKTGEGLVTNADLEADELIRHGLAKTFPHDTIVTEESFLRGSVVPKSKRVWFVDPIDGTADYVRGGDDFVVMIGLALNGFPVLGVLFQPISDTLWMGVDTSSLNRSNAIQWAEKTSGKLKVDLDIRHNKIPETGPLLAVSRNSSHKFVDYIMKELGSLRTIKKGSVGLKMMLVAEGQADLYIAPPRRIKVWDTCAPEVIVRAAGGTTHTAYGTALDYTLLATHHDPFYSSTPACSDLAEKVMLRALTT